MERRPNILVIAFPSPGHVVPMIELSQCLVQHGFKITFVNTDSNHQTVLSSLSEKDHIDLVSIPDGLEPWEDRNNSGKLFESLFTFAPQKLEELIHKINASEEDEMVTGVIADWFIAGWVLGVAEKMNIRRASFFPASAALLTQLIHLDKLIDDGIIDNNGTPTRNQTFQLAPGMPVMSTADFLWGFPDEMARRIVFDLLNKNNKAAKSEDWMLCNSFYDLEPQAFTLGPMIRPIGPLLASNRLGNSARRFLQQDMDCMKWLDQQPPKSVIYVSFGGIPLSDETQLRELAMGLELTGKPFLWVVIPSTTKQSNAYLKELEGRVGNCGKLVEWAPQQKVLSHPSMGCFVSHCCWNSTIEGVGNGVPFLCWPFFVDQFSNEKYICDVWKIGLNFNRDEYGIIKREEIKNKVEEILSDEKLKARAEQLKEKGRTGGVGEYGHSKKNFNNFVEWLNEIVTYSRKV